MGVAGEPQSPMPDRPTQGGMKQKLAERSWIGFDLDDTLHEFRRASSKATNTVLEIISAQYGPSFEDLKAHYSTILRRKTAGGFAEGKISHEYREERFRALAEHFSIDVSDDFMAQLLRLYEVTLRSSLELKDGVLELLKAIKAKGKKIAVITEGPQDAQERTVEALGIAPYLDFLATTNYFKVSKVDGLFPKVLLHLQISHADMVYVGDSEERDIVPATAAGIFSIHFSADDELSLNVASPRIPSLATLIPFFN